jgi:hypothetical protein
MEPEQTFTIPYRLEGSRHDQVVDRLLEQEQAVYADQTVDRSDETFCSAADRQQAFNEIIDPQDGDAPHVLVSEFALYEDAGWRTEVAVELDIARFDRAAQTVYCIESKGRNLESLQVDDDELADFDAGTVDDLTMTEKKEVAVTKAVQDARASLDSVRDYMERFGWEVEGLIAAFYQYGNQGRTAVELYPYTPGDGR